MENNNWFSTLPERPYIKLLKKKKMEWTPDSKTVEGILDLCVSLSGSKAVNHWFPWPLPESFPEALRQHYLEVNVLKAHTYGALIGEINSLYLNTDFQTFITLLSLCICAGILMHIII